MTEYNTIKSPKDVKLFDRVTNGLHDGYITSIEYKHNGINANGGMIEFDYSKITLKLCIWVSSLKEHPTVEIIFRDIEDCQLCSIGSDFLDCYFTFQENGYIIWSDDCGTDRQSLRESTYVIAGSIYWRIL